MRSSSAGVSLFRGRLLHAPFTSSRVRDGAVLRRDVSDRAQVCIVGTGAGGAAVAYELSRRGHSVVLLEEGGLHLGVDLGDPYAAEPAGAREIPLRQAGGATIRLKRARCVGGTTVLGAGTCERISDAIFDAWAEEHDLQDLRGGALEPYYDQAERDLGVSPVPDATYGRNAELLELGARQVGFEGARVKRSVRDCVATGVCDSGCPQDARQGMHVSYVPEAIERGAVLYQRARARELLISQGRIFGVVAEFLDADGVPTGRHLRIVAERVVVAGGALATPLLLSRGGAGDGHQHLGRHLRLHPTVRIAARFPEEVRSWAAVPEGYGVRGLEDREISIRSHAVPPHRLAIEMGGFGAQHKEAMGAFARLASFAATIRDDSEGTVRAGRRGRMAVDYRLGELDRARIVRAVGLMGELAFAAGAEEVYTGVVPSARLTSRDEARALSSGPAPARALDLDGWCPVGTARMSNDPARGVTDGSGRVHGIEDLYVADASLLPGASDAGPELTIVALGLRIGEQLSAGLGAPL